MVKIRQNLVDTEKYGIKCPHEIKPAGITIHNTANNASAENEIAYMRRNDNEVSFHYAVDDIEIVQGILENRNAWHAGDKNGPGNMTTIAIEICYSTGDKDKFEKAQKNAAEFTAAKLKEYGWEIDKIYPHKHWSGKHCPHRTLDDYGWDYFIDLVKSFLNPKVEQEKKPLYRVRKSWTDAKSQKGAYTNLPSAQKCCDEAGAGYEVYNEAGEAIYPEREAEEIAPKEEKVKPFEIGALVKLSDNAIWANGKTVASWVRKSKLYLRDYKSDEIASVSTQKTGAITGTINIKYLQPYTAVATSTFKPYIVQVAADRLNVRAGAGTKYKVTAIIKKNQLYTIVDEKDGWGKLKSGSGWISLAYVKKVVKK